MRLIKITLLSFALLPFAYSRAELGGLNISASADFVASFGQAAQTDTPKQNDLQLRTAELMLYGAVDPYFDAVLSFAAHPVAGSLNAEVHEAFVSLSRALPRTRVKAGQFFLGVGRLGRLHQHEWPFVSVPYAYERLLGLEGLLDLGLEVSHLFPTAWPLTVVAGLSNGRHWGHSHSVGPRPKVPVHYGRLSLFQDLGPTVAMEEGLSYIGRTGAMGVKRQALGFDFVLKWDRPYSPLRPALLQSEFWYRQDRAASLIFNRERSAGIYVFGAYPLSRRFSLGALFDVYRDWDRARGLQAEQGAFKHTEWAFEPVLQFWTSEFFRFSSAYRYTRVVLDGAARSGHQALLQMTLGMGAHPSHDF